MPLQRCQRNNQPGFRWGDEGRCYTYPPGDAAERERARQKALEQGRAIEASVRRERQEEMP